MNISELNILSFGKFNNKKIILKPGLNIIYGENEAGKSTIHKFIESMLFGFVKSYTKTKRYTKDYEKYFPWNDSKYQGILKYYYNNDLFRVERNFIKGNDDVKIFDERTGENISGMFEYNPISRTIEPSSLHFGINKIIYKNTISISQLKSKTEDRFSKEVKDNLINLGGSLDNEISIKKVIERLEKRLNDIGTKNRLRTSPYGNLIREVNDLDIEKEKAYKLFSDTKEFQLELKEKKNILDELYKKKEKLEDDIYKHNCKELNVKYEKANKLLEEIDILHKNSYKIKKYKDIKIEDYGEIIKYENTIDTIKENIERINKNILDIKEKLNSINDQIKEYELNSNLNTNTEKLKENKNFKKSLMLTKTFFIIFLVCLIVSLTLGFLLDNKFFIMSFIFIIINFYLNIKIKNKQSVINDNNNLINIYNREKDLKREELREDERFLQNQLVEKNVELERLKAKLNNEKMGIKFILDKNKFETPEELKKGIDKKRKFENIIHEINYKREILSGILSNKTFEELEEEVKKCSDIDISKFYLEDNSLLEKLSELNNVIIERDKEISNLEEKIKTMHSLFRPIQEIEEQIYTKKQQILKCENEIKSIEIAKETIEKISKSIHREFAPKLNKEVSDIISTITKGKYKDIKITENLETKIVSKDDVLIDIENLSYGTIDQIYFSLRFGIIDIIKKDKKIPLILDDCFIQYDDIRLDSILDFIYEQSKQRQVILFTCQTREQNILKNKGYNFNYIEI
ncbi:ATP-binding protein [Senegalia massiliensis]|uniref:YhaN AAA domain-containing protein n=1 Tax=Senegalia massiliensis TaxID=1720316 RepID=A0A845QTG4_9CLOT|nr:AAA family ATPase [Senegalia massiliensis]NBI05835.1 hypothetical protein [Senegalia massiliensis]